MKIAPKLYRAAYKCARKVYAHEMRQVDARGELARLGLNPNSARDFVYIFKAMLNARGYKRAMSADATEHFITGIRRDYGESGFSNAIEALRKHIPFNAGAMRRHKALLAKYQTHSGSVAHGAEITFPPEVRLLPMSPEESSDGSIADVQRDFFLSELPSRSDGEYRCKTGLVAAEHSVVLFQYRGHVVASAELLGARKFERADRNGYTGALAFAPRSIRVFEPVPPGTIRKIWPEFRRFGRDKLHLDPKGYPRFQASLRDVMAPDVSADEGMDDDPLGRNPYKPGSLDTRMVVERQIRERRGQQQFRDALRERYEEKCVVTGCKVLDILEAAHIMPYRGEGDNHPENGLLLRADIHTLFDLNLLGITPGNFEVRINPGIAREYGEHEGKGILCSLDQRPSRKAIRIRYEEFLRRLRR